MVLLVAAGHLDAARPLASRMTGAGSKWPTLPAILAFLGADAAAAERAQALKPGPDRTLYDAVTAWRSGDRDRALGLLGPLAEAGDRSAKPAALWVIGSVALEAGRDAEAVAALRRFRGTFTGPGNVFVAAAWGRALYQEAEALERTGARAKARERLDELLAAWQRADADEPILAKARALRRRVS